MLGIPLIEIVALPPRLTSPGDCVTVIGVATIWASVDGLVKVDCETVVVATNVVTGGSIVSGFDVVADLVVVTGFVATDFFVVTGSVIGTMMSRVLDVSLVRCFCVVIIDFLVKTLVV